jgi:hypothetical protein
LLNPAAVRANHSKETFMLHQRYRALSVTGFLLVGLTMLGCDTPPQAPEPAADPLAVDQTVDPDLDTFLANNSSCGKTDQLCCGNRAHSFKGLAKRCTSKNTVCPQSESSDICTPCGLLNDPCCIVNGKPQCRDGSTCAHSVPGGKHQEAGSGICISL